MADPNAASLRAEEAEKDRQIEEAEAEKEKEWERKLAERRERERERKETEVEEKRLREIKREKREQRKLQKEEAAREREMQLQVQLDTDTQASQASSENSVYGPTDDEEESSPVAKRPPRPVERPVSPRAETPPTAEPSAASISQEVDVEEEDDDNTVTLTSSEVLANVEKAWLNEKLSPELLVPLLEETDCLQEQLRILENNFKILSKTDIRLPIHQMEGQRITFLLTSYYRVRLMKIQKFPWFILNQELNRTRGVASRLTPQELKFLKEYTENVESHLLTVGIQNMPAASRKVPEHLLNFPPNLDSYVFFKSNINADIVIEGPDREEEDVSLEAGSRYVMRYRPVSHLLHSDKIELI